ncbi:hypothetical protein NDU88_008071 [Pleurodeles waltl]|uniref:Uncharacterized protein n=1 Tax=Pleurodeles waltl TaxID=8319 RepID=A0AAV7PNQ4_PLEWA|nr:hypothetical protein NDU88_008071 [Pleurodeles waltl]
MCRRAASGSGKLLESERVADRDPGAQLLAWCALFFLFSDPFKASAVWMWREHSSGRKKQPSVPRCCAVGVDSEAASARDHRVSPREPGSDCSASGRSQTSAACET